MNEYHQQAKDFLDSTDTQLIWAKIGEMDQSKVWGDKDNKLKTVKFRITLCRGRNTELRWDFDWHCSHQDYLVLTQNIGALSKSFCNETPVAKYNEFKRLEKEFFDGLPYDVLAGLSVGYDTSFEEFCDSFGYDSDSRRAYKTYIEVQKQSNALKSMYNEEELERLNEIS